MFNLFLYLLKVVKMPVSTAVTVTLHVPPTVKATHVTYRTERVSRVNLGGLGHIVIQVKSQNVFFVKYYFFNVVSVNNVNMIITIF